MEKLYDIIRNAGMSSRPAYYSGRGATMSDLNSSILEKIYAGIEKEFGKESADSFAQMVGKITILSATTFLQELELLYSTNWKSNVGQRADAPGIDIAKDEDGNHNLMSGFATMFEMMKPHRDDTNQIRGEFLRRHGIYNKSSLDDLTGNNYRS